MEKRDRTGEWEESGNIGKREEERRWQEEEKDEGNG